MDEKLKEIFQSKVSRRERGVKLGSTPISAHANGSWRGEIAYTPFGEMRSNRGVTVTDYRYTGQRSDGYIKLIDMGARRYDPALGSFISADTIIPNPVNPLDLNRYSYARFNPLKYVDPSGHVPESDNDLLNEWSKKRDYLTAFGITVKGIWEVDELKALWKAAHDISKAFVRVLGGASADAFKSQYKDGLVFTKSTEKRDYWGVTENNVITVFANANVRDASYNNFLVHEMGHAYDNEVSHLLTETYKNRAIDFPRDFPGSTPMPSFGEGFGYPASLWVLSRYDLCETIQDKYYEETANMFLGWVYGVTGSNRGSWMNVMMQALLTGVTDYNSLPRYEAWNASQ